MSDEERVERYAAAMRDVVGAVKVTDFHGEFTDETGQRVAYIGSTDSIFEDYARAVIAVADAERAK